jgi:thiazole synthase ThiGH ThiG subunit
MTLRHALNKHYWASWLLVGVGGFLKLALKRFSINKSGHQFVSFANTRLNYNSGVSNGQGHAGHSLGGTHNLLFEQHSWFA